MAPVYSKNQKGLGQIAEDHSAEAVSVLTMEPSKLIRRLVLVLASFLFAAVIWSFIGRLDTIVQAPGAVKPESQEMRVFVPVKGQLADIFVAEGMLVSKGDVLARVNSPSAIELAGQATTAYQHMLAAQRKLDAFPAAKKTMEAQIESLSVQIANEEQSYERNSADGLAKLAVTQSLKLEKAQAKLAKADEERLHAERELAQYQRLFDSPGGGGISGDQIEEKAKLLREKEIDYQLAEVELSEFEIALSDETAKKKEEILKKSQNLVQLQGQYDNMVQQLTEREQSLQTELRLAKTKARSSAQVQYKDIDDENFLLIRAPEDGIVTQVTQAQVGNTVDTKDPIVAIASSEDRKVLEVRINERDRAFLTPGMPVKIKVNAFAYQRYGHIEGELEHIAPATVMDQRTKGMVYTARVRLDRDFFLVNEIQTPVRYGMTANAEIVVRKRRLIDLALDPLRNAAG
ncbi:MAG: HlyD family efflux transporter periplasmic adaptor subunit [Pseudomonadota bacterium]